MPTSYSEFINLCNYCVSKKSLCNLKANTFCILKSNYVGKQGKKPWQNLFLVTEDNAIRNSNGNKDQCVKFLISK